MFVKWSKGPDFSQFNHLKKCIDLFKHFGTEFVKINITFDTIIILEAHLLISVTNNLHSMTYKITYFS